MPRAINDEYKNWHIGGYYNLNDLNYILNQIHLYYISI